MIPIASEHSRIASVWHCNEPNARLIAAAPDLLAALEAARDELDSCDRFKPGLVKLDVMLDIRDAIAKARGD